MFTKITAHHETYSLSSQLSLSLLSLSAARTQLLSESRARVWFRTHSLRCSCDKTSNINSRYPSSVINSLYQRDTGYSFDSYTYSLAAIVSLDNGIILMTPARVHCIVSVITLMWIKFPRLTCDNNRPAACTALFLIS